jgi:release factor family 10
MTWKHHVKGLNALLKLEPQLASADERTLTLYLPVRAEGFEAKHYDLLIEHVVDDYRRDLDERLRPVLDAEVQRVHTHLNLVRPAGCPALVVFSNEGQGLLSLIRLPESVDPRVEVGPPLLAPLELLVMHHPPALVVVLDKQEARIFASVLGEVGQLDHFEGQEVKHTRAGGTSAASNQRRADNRARANLKHVVDALDREVTRGEFTRILVAGPEEARSQFMRELPKSLGEKVAGTLRVTLDNTPGRLATEIREQIARAGRVSSAA